ncbi:uncharacterized protein LOC134830048 [Culicoides brevitarsis]|uniref:uncharacterized protein LOC134830048 n=1 Tax=Culicoides brevitarsis TaxID=469753 RepID=UPI00307B1B21
MELSRSSFKHQMKSVEKRHQQYLINHHLPIAITNSDNNKLQQQPQTTIHSKKAQNSRKQRQSSNVLINHPQLLSPASAYNFQQQQQPEQKSDQQHHSTGLVAKTPVSFPLYELALPATLLAFIIFGILFILGFTIYKFFKHFCGGHKQKRRLTKDNIYYQTVRKPHSATTPIKSQNTLFYRYRFTPKKALAGMNEGGLLDDEDIYATNSGGSGVISINEESKCKKSPPPSPYVEEEMRTPDGGTFSGGNSSNPNSPSFIVSIPQYTDEINSNLNTQDRSALQFLHGDIHYVQPMMMTATTRGQAAEQGQASYLTQEEQAADCDNLNKIKQQITSSPRQNTTDSSASSPLFTACEIISGSTLGSASRFSFSPKNLKEMSASPLLPSAGLKHGNYFKFPEVDIFTPTNKTGAGGGNNNNEDDEQDKEIGTPIIENLHISDDIMPEVYKTPLNLEIEEPPPNTLTIPEAEPHEKSEVTKNNKNLLAEHRTRTRRVRLKSISLDSDQARLVEENIGVPVEELVGGSTSNEASSQMCGGTNSGESKLTRSNTGRARKINKFNLTINVVDQSEGNARRPYNVFSNAPTTEAVPVPPQTPKTPIQKAASLDSEPTFLPPPHSHTQNVPSSSISVPSTPKRQPFAGPKHKYAQKMYTTANKSYGCLRQPSIADSGASGSNNNLYHYSKCTRKLRSYDENISSLSIGGAEKGVEGNLEDAETGGMRMSTSGSQMCSLQVTKFNTLNVSNTNLKTLPESEKLNDFSDGAPSQPLSLVTPKTEAIPATAASSVATGQKNKCSILQRRGSNHSLTLQIDGSISNLARGLSLSNYSLGAMQGSSYNLNSSNYNIATSSQTNANSLETQQSMHQTTQLQQQGNQQRSQQRKLLQRRGSNCSLTLNIKDSNCNLNRFNSQHSLNINKRALSISNCNLNRRNFTSSLNNVVDRSKNVHLQSNEQSSINTDHDDDRSAPGKNDGKDTRKFLSSENLHHFTVWQKYNENQTPYGSIDDLKRTTVIKDIDIDDEWTEEHENCGNIGGLAARNISTKPLSPQSTSEDFKIYLANIQFLQNASRSLNEKQLQSLNELFQKSYNAKAKDDNPVLGGGGSSLFMTKEMEDEEQDQKNALIKLHQEFWDLPTNYQEKPMVFGSHAKNRYKTILPNEHSRVRIDPEPNSTHETYINANFIKGPDYSHNCYIATQGPMTNTIYDFWLMVFQNMQKSDAAPPKDTKIAMLTDFIENNRQKCAFYFPKELNDVVAFSGANIPEENEAVLTNVEAILEELRARTDGNTEESELYFRPSFNYFLIQNVDIRCKNGYSIRKLRVIYSFIDCDDARVLLEFPVFHYWFPDWPDHRSPEDIDGLLDMSLDLLFGDCYIDFPTPSKEIATSPIDTAAAKDTTLHLKPHLIIHCSAGIGRTGCLIAILNGLRQIKQSLGNGDSENKDPDANTANLAVDILQIVCNLRIQRGGMVQNSEQYELIHRAICLYHQRLNLELENHLSTQL